MTNVKKIVTIVGILIILASLGIGAYFVYQKGLLTLEEDTTIKPSKVQITNISHDQFTVSWITEKPTKGVVIYGQNGKLEQTQLDDTDQLTGQSQDHKLHHITLTNLQPSTSYDFKLKSGENNTVFDKDGQAYSTKTAPLLGSQPPTDIMSGSVILKSGKPAVGSIVYTSIPGVTPLSTQVKKDGTWLIRLANARNAQLTGYASYDPSATTIEVSVLGESGNSKAITNTANDSPVPLITLGETYDFTKSVAQQITPNSPIASSSASQMPMEPNSASSSSATKSKPSKLAAVSSSTPSASPRIPETYVQETGSTSLKTEVTIINPAKEDEEIFTNKPEFLGTGPANKVLTIEIHSSQVITGSAVVGKDGNWSFSPTEDLAPGDHEIKISYVDSTGKTVTVKKNFVVASSTKTTASSYPAFVATPSATTSPRPSATPKPTPTPRATLRPTASASGVRSQMPSTTGGVPRSGSDIPTSTLLIFGLGLIISGYVWRKKLETL